MAMSRRDFISYLVSFALYFVSYIHLVNSDGLPNRLQLETLAKNLSASLIGQFSIATNYGFVTSVYNNPGGNHSFKNNFNLKFEEVIPDDLVEEFATKLSKMLADKMYALNRSVTEAEKAAANHLWNNNIKKTDFECLKAKEIVRNESGLVYNPRFKQNIIASISSVHIPVEIYDGDVEILNGLQWSAALDKVFTENFNRDPEILWQYFGSQSGFMRTLPASRWDTGDDVDLYDVRRRPWYTQGSSSPKDMLILIDTSGSVYGQALELIKVAVKSLLDTLGENDFVNIANFSEKAKNVSKCFGGSFVQANYRNKKKLIEEVDKISAEGMANFKAGLEFAFEQFIKLKNETEGKRGADCNRMIMLLTDGGTEYAEDVFTKYNPKGNKTYRVFTYAVGPTANPVSAIRWMACANKGYFSQIPAMGAVRSKVQEYVDVISRPLALYRSNHELWTSIYQGLYQDADYMKEQVESMASYTLSIEDRVKFSVKHDIIWGLGMMTTVTLPVYNRTNPNGATDQTILGVMGIDVTTAAMLKHAPLRKFGPNGFPYAINANGYIVFHPNLKIPEESKDPPNVDFLEVEVESPKKIQMRNEMIDQKENSVIMETFTISQDQRHVDVETGDRRRHYSYVGIDQTTFSLGVSLPLYHKHHLSLETDIQTPTTKGGHTLLNDTHTALLIPDWDFYENFTSGSITGSVLDLQQALEHPYLYNWDSELINHLLFDLSVTSEIDGFWSVVKEDNHKLRTGLVGAFIATMGGLTKIFPKRENLVRQFMEQRDPWKSNYFKRAIDAPHVLFSAPYVLNLESEENTKSLGNDSVGDVMIVKSVTIDRTAVDPNFGGHSLKYKAAVLGSVFTHQHIKATLVEASHKTGIGNCGNLDTTACYLLDDGAFLIATNQEKYSTSVGRFFGKVDPEMMFQLFNNSFYERLEQYDYTATCLIQKDDTTSAANINIPFLTLFYELLTFNWWSSVVTWTITNFNIHNMLYAAPTNALEDEFFNMDKTRECVKKQAQYYFSDLQYIDGETECEVKNIDCSRSFVAHRLENTNLALVISEAEKDGCDKCRLSVDPKDLIQEAVEPTLEEEEEYFCNLKPRYRRATNKCYDKHPQENTVRCTASVTHPVSMTIVFLIAIATTLLISQ